MLHPHAYLFGTNFLLRFNADVSLHPGGSTWMNTETNKINTENLLYFMLENTAK